jgi:hypothetical protein
MQIPCIHFNGTSKEALIRELCNASEALEAAFQALKKTAPNNRDYYPIGAAAFEAAYNEHNARLAKVDDVKKEVDALTCAIDEIGN